MIRFSAVARFNGQGVLPWFLRGIGRDCVSPWGHSRPALLKPHNWPIMPYSVTCACFGWTGGSGHPSLSGAEIYE